MCMQPGVTRGSSFALYEPLMAGEPGTSISPSASEHDGARLRGDSLSCELSDEERLRGAMRKVGSKSPSEAGTSTTLLLLPSDSNRNLPRTPETISLHQNLHIEQYFGKTHMYKITSHQAQGSSQGPHLCRGH